MKENDLMFNPPTVSIKGHLLRINQPEIRLRVVQERWYHGVFDIMAKHTGKKHIRLCEVRGITAVFFANKKGKVYIGK